MTVYNTVLPGWVFERLRLKKTKYSSNESAITAISEALEKSDLEATIGKNNKGETVFRNKEGGDLVTIIKM